MTIVEVVSFVDMTDQGHVLDMATMKLSTMAQTIHLNGILNKFYI